jgi:hypothetical protein
MPQEIPFGTMPTLLAWMPFDYRGNIRIADGRMIDGGEDWRFGAGLS